MGTLSRQEIQNFWRQRSEEDTIDIDKRDVYWDRFEKDAVLDGIKRTELTLGVSAKDIKILDVGCGTGRLIDFLHQRGYGQVQGIDYVPECVKKTKERIPSAFCEVMDAADIAYKKESFDVCIACRTLQSLPTKEEKQKVVREIQRILRKGSYFILIEGNAERLTPHPTYNYYLKLDEWKAIFKEEGFVIESIASVPLSTILMFIDKKLGKHAKDERPLLREHIEWYEALSQIDQIIGSYEPDLVSHEFALIVKKK